MIRALLGVAFAFVTAVCVLSPARADDFWSDYQTALSTFRGGEGDTAKFSERAFEKILDGIDGRWTRLTSLDPKIGDDATVEKACRLVVFDARRTSEFSFSFMQRSGKDLNSTLEYKYTLVNSNIFGFGADDRALLKYYALDDAGLALKLSVLRGANGLAELYRQGPDLLIVKSIFGAPDIFGRCK